MNHVELKRKAIAGLIKFVITLGLFIFLPAWSLMYWQGWVYIFLFFSAAAGIGCYLWKHDKKLLERRLSVGPRAEKEKKQKTIQWFASSFFAAIIIFPAFDHHFGWSSLPIYSVLLGDLLFIVGFYLIFITFKVNSYTSGIIETHADQTVISTGLYAYVRHPMYGGALVMLTGTPLALGSYWGLIFIFPVLITLMWRLLDEERFLSKHLHGYNDYRKKVRFRLVPFIW